VLTTPAVRKIARESGVDLSLVAPTGPHDRILKSDVLNFISAGGNAEAPAASAAAPAKAPVAAAAKAPTIVALPSRGAGAAAESTTVPISGAK
jgi:pyruvate/2-oxoglutarate dehydrogenase complex dihydrolipoamide acyltransferase (E2) component